MTRSIVVALVGGIAAGTPAAAQTVAIKPLVDARFRYEHVAQDGIAKQADAATVRVRAGVEASAGSWSALVEGQGTLAIDNDYFDGLHLPQTRPLVADPENIALYRAQLQYRSKPLTVTLGRQRISLDEDRFVDAAMFRVNSQSFDAARVEWLPTPKLKIDVTYAARVRTIWGIDGRGARQQAVDGDNLFAELGWVTPVGTLTGYAYLVDQDEVAVQGFRLSNQTYGVRLKGSQQLAARARLAYHASYARQSDYHRNPNDYSASFFLVDTLLELDRVRLGAGLEVLGADDGRAFTSFQFPVGSGFKFRGWANKFNPDPPDGVRDLYGSAGYGWKTLGPFSAVSVQAIYHRFESDRVARHYGSEIDLLASAKLKRTTVSLRYADYNADKFATDTAKFWLQLDWTL